MEQPVEVEIGEELPSALYRLYARDGALLYVGVTEDLKTRFSQHAANKSWWKDVARKTVAWYPNRVAAEAAEDMAVRIESPRHNVLGTSARTRGRLPAGASGDKLVALALDRSLSPSAIRLELLRIAGFTNKEAREALMLPERTYRRALQELVSRPAARPRTVA